MAEWKNTISDPIVRKQKSTFSQVVLVNWSRKIFSRADAIQNQLRFVFERKYLKPFMR